MSDSKKLILKGFLYTSIGLVFSKIFTYGWRIIAARVGVEEYGMLSIVLAVMNFLIPIGTLGLGFAIERYVSYYIGKDDIVGVKSTIVNSLKISTFFSIFVAFCLFFSSDFLASSIFKNPELGVLLKLFSVFLPFLVLDTVIAPLFRAYNRLDYFTFVKYLLEASLKFFLAFFLISLGYGIFGVAFAYLISISLSAILLFRLSKKHCFNFLNKTIRTRDNVQELLKYSMPLVFSTFAVFVLSTTDILMIGYFKGSAQAGIYNVAYPTANLLLLVPTAMLAVFLPIITKNFAQNKSEEIKTTYMFVTKWIFVFNFFMFLVMFAYSEKLITFLFGPEYISGAIVLQLLAIGFLLKSVLGMSAGSILEMHKKTKTIMNIILFCAVLNILFNYYLIPLYGIMGGAVATLICNILIVTMFQYFAAKTSKIIPVSRHMIYSAVCSIILFYGLIYAAHIFFGSISVIFGLIIIPVIGLLYLAVLYYFKIINLNEFQIMFNYFKRK